MDGAGGLTQVADTVGETSVSVGGTPLRHDSSTATAAKQVREKAWSPNLEKVEGWAFKKDISHYDVLGVEETADDQVLKGRTSILKARLSQWANNATDFRLQQVGSSGLSRFVELSQALSDPSARSEYNEQLKVERHKTAIRELRKEVEIDALDMVLQWSEWIGLQDKARALGATSAELEEIISEFRSKGVLTGLSLPGLEREVRTINELKDACSQNAQPLIEPLWNGMLEDWLCRAANKPQLKEFASGVREEYADVRLSGAWLFLWEIGEKRLILENASGAEELLSAEAWAQAVESGALTQSSIEALRDRRLENWFHKATGREDLGRLAQQFREEQEEDLGGIVRVIRAKGTDPIFEWRDGSAAYSLAELAGQCDKNLDEAKAYLFNKSFETRLQQLGKAPLATAASTLRSEYKDFPRHGVEVFTREICKTAKINPYPILAVQQDLGFGKVRFGETQIKTMQIENRGRGYAWGTIKLRDNLPGLTVPGSFDLDGNSRDIEIKLDTSTVAIGQYSTELTIEGEGLPEPSCVSISYEVAPLDLAIHPNKVEMGQIPVGGTAKASLTITNNGRGRSAGRAKLEADIPGLTFTEKFAIDDKCAIDLHLDTISLTPGKHTTNLVVEGEGFPRTFKIPLSFEVLPLEVKFDPPVVNLGKIMHGTKSKATLKVSCTPEGGRLSGTTKGIKPPCAGLAVQGRLKGQLSEFEIHVDSSKLEAGKRFKIKLLFDTNVNKLEVPIEFRTSMRPNSVIAWQTIGSGLAAGLVMYFSRALLQNVEGLNQWFFSYQSGTSLIIATGAFGALVTATGVLAFRHSKIITSIVRRLRSTKSKTTNFVKELDDGDSVHGLGLDGGSPLPNPIEGDELQSRMRRLSDEELLKIVHVDFRNYRQETLSLAEAEVKRRGLEKEHS
jgi:hypothetical protein